MKNTLGTSVCITIFGESHGAQIGAVLDGLAPGIKIDEAFIAARLTLRRPAGTISTARVENDAFSIVSGVFNGKTTGTPICILIPNTDVRRADYDEIKNVARPGHADYTAYCKYHGFSDYRGGGHFSGRLTAAIVAAGAIAQSALNGIGVKIGTHLERCGGVSDRGFDTSNLERDIETVSNLRFATLDNAARERMLHAINAAADAGDSVGGVLETAITGIPAGVGEPFFDSVESVLSHAIFSIPAVKGIEFGSGFAAADSFGSDINDSFRMTDSGTIITDTNHNGGVNGGITNGMPIIFRTAIKPTPSIRKEQQTVDFEKRKNTMISIQGRHDPAIVHRARAVVDAVTALAICDLLALRFGTDFLKDGLAEGKT